ncbi:MFS transporter [Ammoniphilus sp. YIM 78166]|uniref:MFS transporter n=1 Tax=Ammoniphilus sp. YIM 78166 TaxID=1644106 RepID=UPI001F0E1618|nr:MFS transporter [Ammoniphilus sp. YIM 78166]
MGSMPVKTDQGIGNPSIKSLRREEWTVRGLTFSYYATNAILVVFLPLYFSNQGYHATQIGLLMMFGPFVAMFSQPVWGYLSDRYQSIKKIIIFLWSMTILSSAGLFLSHGFALALFFVVMLYFFFLPSNPLLDSLVIKTTMKTGASYGSVRLWGSIGFGGVAILAGMVVSVFGIEVIPKLYYGIWVLPMLLLLFMKNESGSGRGISLTGLRAIGRNTAFLWFLCLVFVLTVPHRMNDSMFALYLKAAGGGDALVGWAWAIAAIGEVIAFALVSRVIPHYNELGLLAFVGFLYTVRWTLMGWVSDPLLLLLLQGMHMVTFAIFWITAIQYVVKLIPEELRSTGQSLFSAVFMGLAGITGGGVGGWIMQEWGGETMYFVGASMTFLATVLLIVTMISYRKTAVGDR